jgi:hypothetical protein
VAHSAATTERLRDEERECQAGRVIEKCAGGHLNPAYVAAHPHINDFASRVLDALGDRLVKSGSMSGNFDELSCQNDQLEAEGRCPHKDDLGWCDTLTRKR